MAPRGQDLGSITAGVSLLPQQRFTIIEVNRPIVISIIFESLINTTTRNIEYLRPSKLMFITSAEDYLDS